MDYDYDKKMQKIEIYFNLIIVMQLINWLKISNMVVYFRTSRTCRVCASQRLTQRSFYIISLSTTPGNRTREPVKPTGRIQPRSLCTGEPCTVRVLMSSGVTFCMSCRALYLRALEAIMQSGRSRGEGRVGPLRVQAWSLSARRALKWGHSSRAGLVSEHGRQFPPPSPSVSLSSSPSPIPSTR